MAIRTIPLEILQLINQLGDKSSNYNSMFVCKAWHTPAIEAFYRDVSLSGNKIKLLNTFFSPRNKEGLQFGYGHLNQTLSICLDDVVHDWYANNNDNKSKKLRPEDFLKLLSYLPNLKTIDLSSSDYSNYYLAIIRDAGEEYLKHIEEFQYNENPKDDSLIYAIQHKFPQTLTHLEIFCEPEQGHALGIIPYFSRLTHLSITNYRDEDLTIFHILDICPPTLAEFKYYSHLPIPHNAGSILDNMTEKTNCNDDTTIIVQQALEGIEYQYPFIHRVLYQILHLSFACFFGRYQVLIN